MLVAASLPDFSNYGAGWRSGHLCAICMYIYIYIYSMCVFCKLYTDGALQVRQNINMVNCWQCSVLLQWFIALCVCVRVCVHTWVENQQGSPVCPSCNDCRRSVSDGPPAPAAETTGPASSSPVGAAYSSDSTCKTTWEFHVSRCSWKCVATCLCNLFVWTERRVILTMGLLLPVFPLWWTARCSPSAWRRLSSEACTPCSRACQSPAHGHTHTHTQTGRC